MSCARGEHAPAAAATARWQDLGSQAGVVMEPEDDPDALPPGEIFEGMLEVATRQQLDDYAQFIRRGVGEEPPPSSRGRAQDAEGSSVSVAKSLRAGARDAALLPVGHATRETVRGQRA